jgi:8-oxo-dGDP phosphatase
VPFHIARIEPLLESVVFRVERRFVEGNGEVFDRDVVVHPGAVVILAIDDQNRVGVLRQYRASFDQMNWELPAGTCDVQGEAPLETAKRELAEELGVESDNWTQLHVTQISPGWTDQLTTLFMAKDLRHVAPRPTGPEERFLEVHWLDRESVRELLASGEPLETTLTIGFLHFLGGS